MVCKIDTPWKRYALIADLSQRFHGKPIQFGKTALQKIVYLLQELTKVPTNYEFVLYTHGPFTAQLLGDLDLVEAFGAVEVKYIASGYRGYQILPGSECKTIRDKDSEFIGRHKAAIDQVVNEFGDFSAKELELRSTIVYLDRDVKRLKKDLTRIDFIGLVNKVKPRFTAGVIAKALEELENKDYVTSREGMTPTGASSNS
jgi:uncharacterized protein YwgA